MSYLIIALIGLTIFTLTIRSWMKVKRSIHGHKKPITSTKISQPAVNAVVYIFMEWLSYVRGENNDKLLRNLAISVVFFAALIYANYQYVHFNWPVTLFAGFIVLFIFQLIRGRAVKYALFQASFPEVITMVSAAISSGASIHNAIERCGQEIDSPLGHEFNKISRRLNLGENPEEVLNDAWRRFRYPEFYSFIILILLSMQRGGQLTELMKRLGRIVAANKTMNRRKAALTSDSRTSVKIIGALPFIVLTMMKFLSPENFDFLLTDPRGNLVLYYVVGSQVLGFCIIWTIIRRAT